jgi:hypothetical protein
VSGYVELDTSGTYVKVDGMGQHVKVQSIGIPLDERKDGREGVILTWDDVGAILAEALRQLTPAQLALAKRSLAKGIDTVRHKRLDF